MITYAYWTLIIFLTLAALGLIGIKHRKWSVALGVGGFVLITGWAYYYFYLGQVMVKHWGGVMSISVPEGQRHIGATWKDDNLWIENYDPATNRCIFSEYSRGNMLEGKVTIKNCNPLAQYSLPSAADTTAAPR